MSKLAHPALSKKDPHTITKLTFFTQKLLLSEMPVTYLKETELIKETY